jgi:hypothetical protein
LWRDGFAPRRQATTEASVDCACNERARQGVKAVIGLDAGLAVVGRDLEASTEFREQRLDDPLTTSARRLSGSLVRILAS